MKKMNRLEPPGFHRTESRRRLIKKVTETLLPYKISKEIDRFIYDVSVITYARLKEKKSNSERKKAELSRKNLARILETLQWFYSNDVIINASREMLTFFGNAPTYKEACKYFDEFLISEYNFDNGNSIIIDDNSKKLMCKDSDGRHILDEQHYLESRGKRLPFIKDALKRLNHCYEFVLEKGKKQQFILLNQYCYPIKGGQNYEYFVMILRRVGSTVKKYRLITAYSIQNYRDILNKIALVTKKDSPFKKLNEE